MIVLGARVPADRRAHPTGRHRSRTRRSGSTSRRSSTSFAIVADAALFFIGGAARSSWCPTGIQNIAESSVEFVRDQVIMQTMGPDGLGYLPFLATLFFFIFFSNISEVIPVDPVPARTRASASRSFLALMVWVIYIVVGFKHQGPLHYLKNSTWSRPACRRRSCSSSRRSSSSRSSSCGRSRWPSDSSPTCSPATSSW